MKQFWTAQAVYAFLKEKYKGGLLAKTLAAGTYCTENFCWGELLVNQSEIPSLSVLENLRCAANRLQAYRDVLFGGASVVITSAWRSESYNKKIGGAPQSKHVSGQAIDFVVKKTPPSKVQTLLSQHSGGLGAYCDFTHIDISSKRRWSASE